MGRGQASALRARARLTKKTIGKPCAGNLHARFERGFCPFADDLRPKVKGQNLPMVRRDDVGLLAHEGGYATSCRELPAGDSPASVTAGEPSSRPAARGEILEAEAGRRKRVRQRELFSLEQARGPQLHVKSAASTEKQSGGRAVHVTAKAAITSLVPDRGVVLGGVRDAARVQGSSGNTRGPSAPSIMRQSGSNKSMTKSSAAQRGHL